MNKNTMNAILKEMVKYITTSYNSECLHHVCSTHVIDTKATYTAKFNRYTTGEIIIHEVNPGPWLNYLPNILEKPVIFYVKKEDTTYAGFGICHTKYSVTGELTFEFESSMR